MAYSRSDVAKVIDHAVLKPEATNADVMSHAAMCKKLGVGNLCVRPCDVALAARELVDCETTVGAVIGFPHGSNRSETKALEARLAIEDGADELDMVMNIGRFLTGDTVTVQKDIEAVVAEAKPTQVPVKVILETCLLTLEQVAQACRLAQAAGADYVKTSTGFSNGGATPEVIDVMINTVGATMKIKASGGIRSWETAVSYLDQGCSRLGVGSTEAVLNGASADLENSKRDY
jgi:deoxyribose-phosphate aldolase